MTDSPYSLAKRMALSLTPESTAIEAVEVVDSWMFMREAYQRLEKEIKSQILEYCKARGAIYHPASKKRFYAGNHTEIKKKVPVEDIHKIVLEGVSGDEEKYLECLSANAFKPSEVRKAIGNDNWNKIYSRRKKLVLVPKDWDGNRGKGLEFELKEILMEFKKRKG